MSTHVMAFSESVVIDRRPEEVFDQITDPSEFLAKLRKESSIEVDRLSGNGELKPGAAWRISGDTRLGRRTDKVEITEVTPPHRVAIRSSGRGFAVNTVVTISAAAASKSRFEVANDLFAITFAARLLAPAVRLSRRRVTKGLRKGLRRLKKKLEADPGSRRSA